MSERKLLLTVEDERHFCINSVNELNDNEFIINACGNWLKEETDKGYKLIENGKIIFSKELNPENYSAEINFTPTLDFEIETPTYEKKSLIIKLKEKPKFNTNYKLSISGNILDKNNNNIPEKGVINVTSTGKLCGMFFAKSNHPATRCRNNPRNPCYIRV